MIARLWQLILPVLLLRAPAMVNQGMVRPICKMWTAPTSVDIPDLLTLATINKGGVPEPTFLTEAGAAHLK